MFSIQSTTSAVLTPTPSTSRTSDSLLLRFPKLAVNSNAAPDTEALKFTVRFVESKNGGFCLAGSSDAFKDTKGNEIPHAIADIRNKRAHHFFPTPPCPDAIRDEEIARTLIKNNDGSGIMRQFKM